MALIKTKDKNVGVEDNSSIFEACKELGVPFSCQDGDCGTCMVEVEEGMENLEKRTESEKRMTFGDLRLACQCRIKSGEVKIKL